MIEQVLQALSWILAATSVAALAIALWSFTWPSVKGTVVISFVDDRTEQEDLHVWYSYTVGPREYVGSWISPLGLQGRFFTSVREKYAWYFDGAVVDVHYCPWLPRWACLERGGVFPALLAGLGAVVLWQAI